MIARVRNVEHIEIVVLPVKTKASAPSAKEELKTLRDMQAAHKNYAGLASCQEIVRDGKIGWSKNLLLKAASYHAAEEAEDFSAAFHRHILRKSYK
jgi:hypothetical protein